MSRASKQPTRDAMLATFKTEGGGAFDIELIDPASASAMNLAAAKGHARSVRVVGALQRYFHDLSIAEEPPMCLTCDDALDLDDFETVLMISPKADTATTGVMSCVCNACMERHPTREGFTAAVVAAYGRYLIANPRVVTLSPGVGHA